MFFMLMVGAPGSPSAPVRRPTGDVALMVDAPRSTALGPLRGPLSTFGGPPSTVLSVDGGRSRIYSSDTSQGARRRCLLQ
jgi:hypothetical protein